MASTKKEVVPDAVRVLEGETLRRLMDERKVSHQALASRADLGTKAYVSQILSGHRPLNIEAASRIARTLNVKIDEFSTRISSILREATLYLDSPSLKSESSTLLANAPIPIRTFADNSPNAAVKWPFQHLTPSQFAHISEGSRNELEAIARGMYMESNRMGNTNGS